MKFTPMKYEPVVVSLGKEELWWTYVVYPTPKVRLVPEYVALMKKAYRAEITPE